MCVRERDVKGVRKKQASQKQLRERERERERGIVHVTEKTLDNFVKNLHRRKEGLTIIPSLAVDQTMRKKVELFEASVTDRR